MLALAPHLAQAQLKVVTSTTDLYDIAKSVGGDKVNATHIGEGYQDPHFIEAKPSFVLQLRNADVWAFVGLDLEIGWMPLLLDGARNPKIRLGGSGYVDASKAIRVLDTPQGNVDRSMGDVHPLGNPHYWLDPENGRRIARCSRRSSRSSMRRTRPCTMRTSGAFEAKLNAA
jgi:zinc/manganese transport system substrate-binding protein